MGSKSLIKIIGIIPARAGSKSIKNKNLVSIKNNTIIENCYKESLKSKVFAKIICTTDSNKIISLCKKKKIPYIKRPPNLSTDNSNVIYSVLHVLKNERKFFDMEYDFVCLIQPTSLFLRSKDIRNCVNLIKNNSKFNSVQTVHKTPHNYHYLNTRIIKNDQIVFKFRNKRLKNYNKQLKEPTYNFGNFIIVKTNIVSKKKLFFCEPCGYVLINKISSFDLDEKLDIEIANKLHSLNSRQFQ
jgi:hypothetical protein